MPALPERYKTLKLGSQPAGAMPHGISPAAASPAASQGNAQDAARSIAPGGNGSAHGAIPWQDAPAAMSEEERLDRIIDYCEGMVERFGDDFEPNHELEISRRAARRFLETTSVDNGACVITGFNFQEIAVKSSVAITIPAKIDGRPVTSMADIDFNRLGMNMQSRLEAVPTRAPLAALVFPHTMTLVGRGVLNSLLPENTYVPKSLKTLDTTGFAGTIANYKSTDANAGTVPGYDYMAARDFSIDRTVRGKARFYVEQGNPQFSSIDGSLYAQDGTTLMVLALPHDSTIALPEGTQRIHKDAYVYGRQAEPLKFIVPNSMQEVAFNPSSTCLWITSAQTPFYEYASERGWMVATRRLAKTQTLDYDTLDDGSIAIVRVKTHEPHVSIPDEIDGKPVTMIGNNALPKSVVRLDLPSTLISIAGNMPCDNLKRLSLPEGIANIGAKAFCECELDAPLRIPKSVRHIGTDALGKNLVVFESVGASVLLTPAFARRCFAEGSPPFDFERYDRELLAHTGTTQKIAAMLMRLGSPYELTAENRAAFEGFLARNRESVVQHVEKTGDLAALNMLLASGTLDEDALAALTQRMLDAGLSECAVAIIDHRHNAFGHQNASARERFRL